MPTGIYIKTTKHRKKLGEAKKGKTWEEIYGEKEAKEKRKKQSKTMKGNQHVLGKHWRIKNTSRMNKDKVGKKKTEKHKEKIGKTLQGNQNAKGKHQKMSEEGKINIVNATKQRWKNLEYRENHRLKMKEAWKDPIKRRNMVEGTLQSLKNRPTSLEKEMIEIIKKYNRPFKYVGDGTFLIGYKNPDFIRTDNKKVCIEVHNFYHHKNNYREKRANYFKKFGWETIFVNEDEIKDQDKVLNLLKV